MTAVRQRARKQPAEVRREAIIDAAVRVFAGTSYRAAGTAEIARAAGVAEPTIYRHFSSKKDLYLAALDRSSTTIVEAWRAIVAQTPHAGRALGAIGHWYKHHLELHGMLLRLRHRAAAETDDDDVRAALRDGYTRVVEVIAEVIGRGQAQGVFSRAVSAEGAAWLFCGIGQVMDLAALTGMDPAADPVCADALVAAFARAVAVTGDGAALLDLFDAGHHHA